MRRLLTTIFCLLIFAWAVGAQTEPPPVPIMSQYYLIGGAQNGKWLTADKVAPHIKEAFKMTPLDLDGIGKTVLTLKDTGEEFGACPENKVLEFTPELKSNIAVGANADWNLLPRQPKMIAVDNAAYRKIAADFLKTKKLVRPKINLSQIVQVDLEGDGQNEVVIAGNFYRKGLTEMQSAGDYSFVLLRKIAGGKPRNILLEGEFFTRGKGDYAPPNEHAVAAVADLNGDGKMEIVLHSFYYEGSWEQIFEISDGKATAVLQVECMV